MTINEPERYLVGIEMPERDEQQQCGCLLMTTDYIGNEERTTRDRCGVRVSKDQPLCDGCEKNHQHLSYFQMVLPS